MYVIVAEFKIRPEAIGRFGPLIDRQAKESVELEPACHQFDVCQSEGDPAHFLLYEIYDDKAAFERHRGLPHTAKFLEDVTPMIVDRTIRGFNRR
ncbi:MAG: antibiotic biosynthesis monooxygenase [candidate division NC10 bacterium]|nr:antibiotic biosynthesis monooxygenase [candidate division NC10 bacterium]